MDNLEKLLEALNDGEKRELESRLAYLRTQDRAPFTTDEEDVWAAICSALKIIRKLDVFVKNYGKQKYQENCADIISFVREGSRVDLERVQFRALVKIVIECMVKAFRPYFDDRLEIPMGAKHILDRTEHLEWAMDKFYPGYYEAQLLNAIVRMRVPAAV